MGQKRKLESQNAGLWTQVADIAIAPLSEQTGAEVVGVDLTASGERSMVERFNRALADHGVLVFRDQRLDAEHMFQASRLFGDVYPHGSTKRDMPPPPLPMAA